MITRSTVKWRLTSRRGDIPGMTVPAATDALIVGAGPVGLAAAISAARRGIDHLVIDQGPIANGIFRYHTGMTFFTTPELLEIGGHPFTCAGAKPTREEALKYYRGVARTEELRVLPWTRLTAARRVDGGFVASVATATDNCDIRCNRLIIATGYLDQANLLGIPGEHLAHVSHLMGEPHRSSGLPVVIVGGKNSAVEAALLCYRAGAAVTLIHRGDTVGSSVKYWLRPDLENRIAAREITAHFNSAVASITERSVIATTPSGPVEIAAAQVYLLTGYHPDFALLASMGIELDELDGRAIINPDTMETTVPGLYLAGSVAAGRKISEVFIENGRFDGEKIFGDESARAAADAAYRRYRRPVAE